jgi:hypothetical protein
MSPPAEELRRNAAKSLRDARKSLSPAARNSHLKTARTYKALAENETWLANQKNSEHHGPQR